jgi:copper chaperone CopZ
MNMNKSPLCVAIICGLLAVSCGYASPVAAQQPKTQPQYAAVLTVKKMCCAQESVPAIKELSRIQGVRRVSVDYPTRSVMIERTDLAPSPRAIWEVPERNKIEPTRLATPQGVFTSKPRY